MTAIAGEYQFGPDNGRLVLKTTRAGMASKAGHDLTIEVTRSSAHAVVPYSAFMGTLKLRDEVTLELEVDLARAQP